MKKIISFALVTCFMAGCDDGTKKIASNQNTKITVERLFCEGKSNESECLSNLEKRIYAAEEHQIIYEPDQNRW